MEKLLSLLEKYKKGIITAPEKEELLRLLAINEDQFRQASEDVYLKYVQEGTVFLSKKKSAELLRHIRRAAGLKGTVRVRTMPRYIYWLTTAACIAGVILITMQLLFDRRNAGEMFSVKSKPEFDTTLNKSETAMHKALSDGSEITIDPGSMIFFKNGTDSATRDITLIGSSTFNITKDSLRPFTVLANGIATTALGTKFTVSTRGEKVLVKLYSGKVKVWSLKPGAPDPVYLRPGQQLIIDTLSFEPEVAEVNAPLVPNSGAQKESGLLLKKDLVYDQTALTQVLEQLKKLQGVDIKYKKENLDSLLFTGHFKTGEKLSAVLENIAILNNLTLVKTEKGYTLTK